MNSLPLLRVAVALQAYLNYDAVKDSKIRSGSVSGTIDSYSGVSRIECSER